MKTRITKAVRIFQASGLNPKFIFKIFFSELMLSNFFILIKFSKICRTVIGQFYSIGH